VNVVLTREDERRRMARQLVAVVAIAVAATALVAAPPHYAVDAASRGLRHASIGHRWRWAPPPPAEVCEVLRARAGRAVPVLSCPPPLERRADLQVRVNGVRLAAEVAALLLAAWAWCRSADWRQTRQGQAAQG
jgi:hypothetical protein